MRTAMSLIGIVVTAMFIAGAISPGINFVICLGPSEN